MGKKGKKGKGKKEDGDTILFTGNATENATQQNNKMLEKQEQTLKNVLDMKQRYAAEVEAEKAELAQQVNDMDADHESEKNTTFAVTADMARQYKALQDDLIHRINSLETTLTEQKEEYDMTQHELRELITDKDNEIELRDQAIAELKQRMEDMSTEFALMLNQTLRLMKEHANEKLSGEGFEEKTDYGAKLQEYSQKAYAAVTAGPS